MADWETDWSRDVLERIVALLFSLANLADLAAGVPFLRRRKVLGILSIGEAEARAFLVGVSTCAQQQADTPASVADAIRLAARLRALALLLCAMMALPFTRPETTRSRAVGRTHKPCGRASSQAAAPSAPDTS